mgnify:CR=1 FL=1
MLHAIKHAVMITGFVFTMMLVIEYVNVLTRGVWQQTLTGKAVGQYALAALLGVTPGCLGAFAVVAMYSHGVVSLGAVVAAMIATSGDEAFVMLAMVPGDAAVIFGLLLVTGFVCGWLTDRVLGERAERLRPASHGLDLHTDEKCECFPRGRIMHQWRNCVPARGILAAVLAVLILFVTGGLVGPPTWNWIRITVLAVSVVAIFIVATVPDHFLKEHLWEHVSRRHVPKVFLWTLGALTVMHVLTEHLALEEAIQRNVWFVLLVACLVGLIPESGPHLLFVTLYAKGAVPFSVLLASSIVQDGHGMLPLLADSRRSFLVTKAINFLIGLLAGAALLAAGV